MVCIIIFFPSYPSEEIKKILTIKKQKQQLTGDLPNEVLIPTHKTEIHRLCLISPLIFANIL